MRLAPYTTFLSQTKPAGLGSFSALAPPVMSRPVLAQINLAALRKNLRVETDRLQFWTKVVNIGLVPLLVALTGLGLALVKRRRAAAAARRA